VKEEPKLDIITPNCVVKAEPKLEIIALKHVVEELEVEISAPKPVKAPVSKGSYVPPHLRKRN